MIGSRSLSVLASICGSLVALCATTANADVVLDGSIGSGAPGQGVGAGSGFTYDITEDLGERSGDNLFHSFITFDIDTGESAGFSGNGTIDHIFARITGGTQSTIQGRVASTIDGASLWLVNPAGLVIGEGASIDVTGTFGVSSASRVLFDGGEEFIITDPASPLPDSAPLAFGFQGTEAVVRFANSALASNGAISVTARGVVVDGASLSSSGLQLASVESGDIPIESASNAINSADISVTASSLDVQAGDVFISGADILVANSSIISTDGEDRVIDIQGNSLTLRDAALESHATAADGADILVTAQLVLLDESEGIGGPTQIISDAGTTRQGGDIRIDANTLRLDSDVTAQLDPLGPPGNGARIVGAGSGGIAGDVLLNAASVQLNNNSFVDTFAAGGGAVGNLSVQAESFALTQGSRLMNQAYAGAMGGNISIDASASVLVDGNAVITLVSEGDAGGVHISTDEFLADNFSLLNAESFGGNNQGVTLDARSVRFSGEASAQSNGAGLFITSTELLLTGGGLSTSSINRSQPAGSILINTDYLLLESTPQGNASIGANNILGSGDAGSILISADTVEIRNAAIFASAFFGASGAPGVIAIDASTLIMDGSQELISNDPLNPVTEGFADIFTNTFGSPADAGSIRINVDNIELTNAEILSQSIFGGNAGNVDVTAENITLSQSTISASTRTPSAGEPGRILVVAEVIDLMDQSRISTESALFRDGGTIELRADRLNISDSAGISASTLGEFDFFFGVQGDGDGGTINIDVETLNLDDGGFISVSSFGPGDAGDINITASDILLTQQGLITSSATGTGDAGQINLQSANLLQLADSAINTRAVQSGGGDVLITSNGLVFLDQSEISATALGDVTGSDGGNITVGSPDLFVMKESEVTAQAVAGNGGNIALTAEAVIVDIASVIDASSELGVDGVVEVESPNQEVNTVLQELDDSFADFPELIARDCVEPASRDRSSLVVETLHAVQPQPDRYRLSGPDQETKAAMTSVTMTTPCQRGAPFGAEE